MSFSLAKMRFMFGNFFFFYLFSHAEPHKKESMPWCEEVYDWVRKNVAWYWFIVPVPLTVGPADPSESENDAHAKSHSESEREGNKGHLGGRHVLASPEEITAKMEISVWANLIKGSLDDDFFFFSSCYSFSHLYSFISLQEQVVLGEHLLGLLAVHVLDADVELVHHDIELILDLDGSKKKSMNNVLWSHFHCLTFIFCLDLCLDRVLVLIFMNLRYMVSFPLSCTFLWIAAGTPLRRVWPLSRH